MNSTKKDKWKTLRIIKNAIVWLFIGFLVVVLVMTMISRFTGKTPSLFGFSFYRVTSGSMVPELEVGDIILVQGCDGNTVEKGDIITFQGSSGDLNGLLVTHRVVTAPYEQNGTTYLVTRGDANSRADEPITTNQVQGKMLAKIALLRYLFDFFATPWGLLAIIGLIILAFFNEILLFAKTLFKVGDESKPKESVDELIARYQQENKTAKETDSSDGADPAAYTDDGDTDSENAEDLS